MGYDNLFTLSYAKHYSLVCMDIEASYYSITHHNSVVRVVNLSRGPCL